MGYNLEGSEIGAAFGLVQLENLSKNISIRQRNFQIQSLFFDGLSEYFEIPKQLPNHKTAWLAFPILIKENAPFSRKEFQIYLEKENIQTRVVFTGNILRQPMMENVKYRCIEKDLINADAIMRRGVLLPVHHGMNKVMFQKLHKTIGNFVSNI